MIPRGTLDIGWSDLAYGLGRCLLPPPEARVRAAAEAAWPTGRHNLACLSVRSGFDALLRALALPAGSEILLSAITIPDMVRIIEWHGLRAVPLDLCMDRLALAEGVLETALSSRSRVLLLAHLFGSRMPLDIATDFARRNGLLLLEDCAQAYIGPQYSGHPASDVAMFSFGPIKTRTALGGAMFCFRDPDLQQRVAAVQAAYPRQSHSAYTRRLIYYAGLKTLSSPRLYRGLIAACRLLRLEHDHLVSRTTRGFAGANLIARLRQRPCTPLLALLCRRLQASASDDDAIEQRRQRAELLWTRLPQVPRPGRLAKDHSHWVLPIESAHPEKTLSRLWRAGFDATARASSLYVVPPPSDGTTPIPQQAVRSMAKLLYLPNHPALQSEQQQMLAQLLTDQQQKRRR
jgi:dTDP-4-amino-4,6-dideoxygalactose transaminase